MSNDNSPKVEVASDQGHQSRFGLGRFLFRQDGPKESLNAKVAAVIFSIFVILASGYSVVNSVSGSNSNEKKRPIELNGAIVPSKEVNVPVAGSSPSVSRSIGKKKVEVYDGPQVVKRSQSIKIPPGTFVKAKFVTGASNGPAKAILLEALSVDGETVLEPETAIVGQGSSTDDRLNVQFSKMVFKDGSVQAIHALGCDVKDQTVGVRGEKVNRYATMLVAGAGLNFVGGMAQGLQQQQITPYGTSVSSNTMGNAALNGASTATLEQGRAILSDWKQKKSIIQVPSGQEFYVLFDGD